MPNNNEPIRDEEIWQSIEDFFIASLTGNAESDSLHVTNDPYDIDDPAPM